MMHINLYNKLIINYIIGGGDISKMIKHTNV